MQMFTAILHMILMMMMTTMVVMIVTMGDNDVVKIIVDCLYNYDQPA